ncbi:MAG TPA: Rieske 2Fe-2S domain-containing protein [Terracidiphilus sp.]|nr:Rieske 2Fe-2S domain-containing protein [Terracidiphilus sp.]
MTNEPLMIEPQSADPQPVSHGAPASSGPREVSRRWLLFKSAIALNGLVGVALAIPILRYLLAPWKRDESFNSWTSLGAIGAFPIGETRLAYYKNPSQNPWDGQTDNVACYVRHEASNQFKVFAINCAHLGCPVRWFPQSQLFMCPCHGGVYYADGSRASGPPERGLFTYNWQIVAGELQIDAGQMPTLSNSAKLVNISPMSGDSKCSG